VLALLRDYDAGAVDLDLMRGLEMLRSADGCGNRDGALESQTLAIAAWSRRCRRIRMGKICLCESSKQKKGKNMSLR